MKIRKWMGSGLVISVGIFIFSAVALTADAPENIVIDEISSKFAGAPLSHKAHVEKYKNKCTDCHHTYKGEGEVKKCSTCHDPKTAKDNVPDLKNAYHDNCKGCHKKAVAEGKKAPTKCLECHPKKK